MSVHKISSWILYLLMAISIVSAVVFYSIGFDNVEPKFTDQLLGLAFGFVGLGLGVTLILSLVNFVKSIIQEPKKAVKSLLGPVFIIVIILISYGLSDGTVLNIVGYDGSDNVPSMLKFADTALFSMYGLSIIALFLVIVSSIIKLFK